MLRGQLTDECKLREFRYNLGRIAHLIGAVLILQAWRF